MSVEIGAPLSPTAIGDVAVCPRRHGLRRRERSGQAAPRSTAARYGTVAHEVLHAVGRQLLGGDWTLSFDEAWESAVDRQARLAKETGDEDVYGPLVNWPRRDVTRLRLRKQLQRLAEGLRAEDIDAVQTEMDLATSTPALEGRADLVAHRKDGAVWIVDLKTGRVPPAGPSIQHVLQLQSYAHMLREQGLKPFRGSLLSLINGFTDVDMRAPTCRDAVTHYAAVALEAQALGDQAIAHPSVPNCRACSVLSRCRAPLEAIPEEQLIAGEVLTVDGSQACFRVELLPAGRDAAGEPFVIHDGDVATHPSLAQLRPGDHILGLELAPTERPQHFRLHVSSRIVRLEYDPAP